MIHTCPEPTEVGSVQDFGQRAGWPESAVYIGMAGKASRAFGIPDGEGLFGKPWHLADDPRGWAPAYAEYLAKRLVTEPLFARRVKQLHGKTLLCYCTRKEQTRGVEVACHGRLLREAVEMLHHSRRP